MRMHVHLLGVVVSMLAIISEYSSAASPQPFPARPVRFILGYPPGGSSDAVARVLAASVGGRLGQNIVIDNRPGAGGNIAAEIAARSAPDGYTWFLGNNGILATNQALYERLPFDTLKDFAPVVLVASQPSVLVVHPALPVNSVRDLIALAKSKPGQLNYASINSALSADDVKERLSAQGAETQGGTSTEFAAYLRNEIPKWTQVVRESGAKPE